MIQTLTTLLRGVDARAQDRLRDHFALDLIDQRLREADAGLRAAKLTLAGLIQTERVETRAWDALAQRHADLTDRIQAAMTAGRDDLVLPAAQALADMENEQAQRSATLARLQTQIAQLRTRVETGQRRILALRQGATQARAVCLSHNAHRAVTATLQTAPADEAEELIARVLNRDDPAERAEILADIDAGLSQAGITAQLGDAGFGPPVRVTAQAVIARLTAQ